MHRSTLSNWALAAAAAVTLATMALAQGRPTGVSEAPRTQEGKAPDPKDPPKKWRDYVFEDIKPKLPKREPSAQAAQPRLGAPATPSARGLPFPPQEPGKPGMPGPTYPRYPTGKTKKGPRG